MLKDLPISIHDTDSMICSSVAFKKVFNLNTLKMENDFENINIQSFKGFAS